MSKAKDLINKITESGILSEISECKIGEYVMVKDTDKTREMKVAGLKGRVTDTSPTGCKVMVEGREVSLDYKDVTSV